MKPKSAVLRCNSVSAKDNDGTGSEQWTAIIRPDRPWYAINIRELWQYRDLIFILVRRDFVVQYKQTILGPLWFFLQPLLTTMVLTIVFGNIANIPTDGIPPFLFYLSGTVCWGYFSSCFVQTSDIFGSNAWIFGKVYFPRLAVPVGIIIANVLKFIIQLILFLGFGVFYYMKGAALSPNLWVMALPLMIINMALLGLGWGILFSSLTTKYRDLNQLVGFGVQLWMFATPVVYPLSQVSGKYRILFAFNPMTAVVEGFREAFLGTSSLSPLYVIIGLISTLAILFTGLVLFHRIERTFIDTI